MPSAARYLAALIGPLLLSKLLELFLDSPWGQPVVRRAAGPNAVETGKGREVLTNYTKIGSALALTAINRWQDEAGPEPLNQRLARVSGLGWLRYTADVLLGFGVLFRTASDLLEDLNRLRAGR